MLRAYPWLCTQGSHSWWFSGVASSCLGFSSAECRPSALVLPLSLRLSWEGFFPFRKKCLQALDPDEVMLMPDPAVPQILRERWGGGAFRTGLPPFPPPNPDSTWKMYRGSELQRNPEDICVLVLRVSLLSLFLLSCPTDQNHPKRQVAWSSAWQRIFRQDSWAHCQ